MPSVNRRFFASHAVRVKRSSPPPPLLLLVLVLVMAVPAFVRSDVADAGTDFRDGGNDDRLIFSQQPIDCPPTMTRVDTIFIEAGGDAIGGSRRGAGNAGRLSEIHIRQNIKVRNCNIQTMKD